MSKKVHRDAVTGKFVSEQYAKDNPDTTVSETIKVSNSFEAYILVNQNGDVVGNTFFTEANKPEILIPEHHLVKVKIEFDK